ncbi:hypothetical protein EXIGLDRAFT_783293 [Exidia glandulosa HHB12029]|uniref:Uncharacterized protein n=1 Tax=Exidia glandulosa HHB12029 TaxID=1314781 RepID=A0A166N527_EXIGL|nr:hypothetical protein EXIGLDRAFT_783293 [Exidia glandulosa HHB12029]
MAHSARNALQRRLQLDERLLATVEENTTELESARAKALSAVAAAQAALDAIEGDLAHSRARRAELRKGVEDIRLSIRRQQVNALPPELLREIFIVLTLEPDALWTDLGEGDYNIARSHLPFDLAAVCKQWRELALVTPILWSYIGVPAPSRREETCTIHYVYWVHTLLRRSQSSPLDILLRWADDTRWQNDSCAYKILALIVQHSHRWRRFEFHIPRDYISEDTANIFRRPTPLLEWFALPDKMAVPALSWTPTYPRYLPVCPFLERFQSDFNIIPGIGEPVQSFSLLVELEIYVRVPCKRIWAILRNTPVLESLNLQFFDGEGDNLLDDAGDPPTSAISLPLLRVLTVYGEGVCTMLAAAVGLLSLPSLALLRVDQGVEILAPLLTFVNITVTTLCLCDCDFNLGLLPSLRTLRNVKRLELDDCTINSDMLRIFGGVEIDGIDGDGLVRLVQSRISPQPDANGQMVSKLDQVIFLDCTSLPDWIIAEVDFLMGKKLKGPDSDPEDSITENGSEEEAEFTDGESATDSSESSESTDSKSSDDSWIDESEENANETESEA